MTSAKEISGHENSTFGIFLLALEVESCAREICYEVVIHFVMVTCTLQNECEYCGVAYWTKIPYFGKAG